MTFLDVDAPNTNWRGTEDPIPTLFGRFPVTGAAYRVLACRPLDGWARTDATFWHPGTKAMTKSGHTMPYNYWPGWKRGLLLTRAPGLIGAWGGIDVAYDALNFADRFGQPLWLEPGLPAATALPIIGWWGYRTYTYVRDYRFEKHYGRPLRGAIINVLRTREGVDLKIDRALVRATRPGPTGRIFLPPSFVGSDGDRENLIEAVRGRLGSSAIDAEFDMEGARPSMRLYVPNQPPERVSRDLMLQHWNAESPFLGMAAAGPIFWNLGESSPHLGIIGSTGSGKSELAAWIVAQFMRGGAGVVVLDPKDTSHRWLMNVPGVHYCGNGSLSDAVLAVDRELSRRAMLNRDSDRDIDFPRLVVFLEERNTLQDALRNEWVENAPPGRGRELAPAIKALNRIGAMGRSLNITLVMAAQETEQRYIGTRSNYGSWALAGNMGPNHWRTIMGPGGKKPGMPATPGSFGRIVNGHAVAFRAGFPDVKNDPDWLRTWATQGEQIWDAAALLQQGGNADMPRPEPVADEPVADDDTIEMVTLRDMVTEEISLVQLRTWRNRYPDFPQPVRIDGQTHYFDRAAVAAWIANRNGDDDA